MILTPEAEEKLLSELRDTTVVHGGAMPLTERDQIMQSTCGRPGSTGSHDGL
jgi:hypothetical protein